MQSELALQSQDFTSHLLEGQMKGRFSLIAGSALIPAIQD